MESKIDVIKDCLPKDGVILNLWCGNGEFSKMISDAKPHLEIKGFDNQYKNVVVAKKNERFNLKFYEADIENIDFKQFLPNCIILKDCIKKIGKNKLHKVVEKAHESLPKDGLLIINGNSRYLLKKILDLRSFRKLLEYNGFDVDLELFGIAKSKFLCICKKR